MKKPIMLSVINVLIALLLLTVSDVFAGRVEFNDGNARVIVDDRNDRREPRHVRNNVRNGNGDAHVRVGGSSLLFNGRKEQNHEYYGPCPVDLKFTWGVVSTQPTLFTYTLQRSDNAVPRTIDKDIPYANRSVPISEHWRLGTNNKKFRDFQGYIELISDNPNQITYPIKFTLHCQ